MCPRNCERAHACTALHGAARVPCTTASPFASAKGQGSCVHALASLSSPSWLKEAFEPVPNPHTRASLGAAARGGGWSWRRCRRAATAPGGVFRLHACCGSCRPRSWLRCWRRCCWSAAYSWSRATWARSARRSWPPRPHCTRSRGTTYLCRSCRSASRRVACAQRACTLVLGCGTQAPWCMPASCILSLASCARHTVMGQCRNSVLSAQARVTVAQAGMHASALVPKNPADSCRY